MQSEMPKEPASDLLPTDSGYQTYKACGKLENKTALITGGDSGIGRAIAILYAMEGAESAIVYLPEEEEDAKQTKKIVEAKGGQLHLFPSDLRGHEACQQVVQKAKKALGSINILVLNHGYQMMKEDISEISV